MLHSRFGVNLENTERIAFGVYEVALPARFRDGEFRESNDRTLIKNCFSSGVKVFHL